VSPSDSAKRGTMQDLLDGTVRPILQRYGLLTPTDVYPLYESATRAAWGQSLDEAQGETAQIWSRFSQVAAGNPHAWIRDPVTPAAIRTPDASNRMITFPYTKLMVANSAVNQGAAVIVTSLGLARERGISADHLVFAGAGASAHEEDDILARDSYARSPAMAASISTALERNGLSANDIDLVELYSCFPCVVKMARRELGWPLERPASVYGGLTFGGGPIGNCMMHAVAAITEKLRGRERKGLIFANGGFATHSHTMVLSGSAFAGDGLPQDFSAQAEADRLRGPVPPFDGNYEGAGRIEALSIPYGRDGAPAFATVVGLTPAGARFLAHVPREDEAALNRLVSGQFEPVGSLGRAKAGADGMIHWSIG
jgi:acetyl-CoA C-acetyltransferase